MCEFHGPGSFSPRLNAQRFLLTDFMHWTALHRNPKTIGTKYVHIRRNYFILYTIRKKIHKEFLYNSTNRWSLSLRLKNPGPLSSHQYTGQTIQSFHPWCYSYDKIWLLLSQWICCLKAKHVILFLILEPICWIQINRG